MSKHDATMTGKGTIGLTAGASAPETLVVDVVDTLRRIVGEIEAARMHGIGEHVEFRLPVEFRE